jgi:glutamate-1-semialdehyde 2,1-aminomutase
MSKNQTTFDRAQMLIPGGVNSPVRAFGSVDGSPIFFDRAEGARFTDIEGREFLDLCMSWGPLILGHAHEAVVRQVQEAASRGLSYGACHTGEVELAERILRAFDWADQVRMVSSGTEAVMTALRLARGVTRRPLVLKFDGGYHGHSDSLLVSAGSGLVTQAIASSAGVPDEVAATTLVAPLDDEETVEAIFKAHGERIAAIVIEPMPANNGLLVQRDAFLEKLRMICNRYGALLIFDEVISGFRLHYGGYDARCGVLPDICTLGKIVGGGMPIGAVVAPRDIMGHLAPVGPVYQAGTLSGNPVSVAAGNATLGQLENSSSYEHLEALGSRFSQRLQEAAVVGLQLQRQGSILWPYLSSQTLPRRADAIDEGIRDRYRGLHGKMLRRGIYLPPSAYEVWFLSAAHSEGDVDQLADALISVVSESE